jgi:ribosomal protein S18 acetylase RimI-like enzyme
VSLVELMDRNMRAMYAAMARATPGGRAVERDGLLLCGTPRGNVASNMAIVTGPIRAEVVFDETDRFFRREGLPFSLWTRAHADAALTPALEEVGFLPLDRQPGMVFRPGSPLPPLPPSIEIRPVRDDGGRAACATIMGRAFAVYGLPEESTAAYFAALESVVGADRIAVLACHDGHAVAGAVAYFADDVAGVGWIGTLPEAEGRGFGSAVTTAVVRESLARGVRFVNLQASAMGAPLYARLGFTTETHYDIFIRDDEEVDP